MAPHLLRLPAEIRNLIYEYALTVEEGITYYENSIGIGMMLQGSRPTELYRTFGFADWQPDQHPHLHSPNQLQLICSQLHHETSGLILKYNTILLSAQGQCAAINLCARFLRRVTPQQRDSIRVSMKYCTTFEPNDIASLLTLFRFCQIHPKSRIDLHFQYIVDCPTSYLSGAHYLHTVFKKEFPLPFHKGMNPEDCITCKEAYLKWPTMFQRKGIIVPGNFRIFPRITNFEEDRFRSATIHGGYTSSAYFRHHSLVDTDTFVAWAKDWCENGA